jgi:SAM-dependent methyltransferase
MRLAVVTQDGQGLFDDQRGRTSDARRRNVNPETTGAAYDRIARRWQETTPPAYGMAALERALRFVRSRGRALDVGCGSTGRFVSRFETEGFCAEGMDVSAEMIALARERNPAAVFHRGDICRWELPGLFDLITAWDSTFHLPLAEQEPVTRKLCAGLAPGGVLLFTCGGTEPGEITGSFWGEDFAYSTLGVEGFVRAAAESGCFCRHVEFDQLPENHVYLVVQKAGA